jgi:ion channel
MSRARVSSSNERLGSSRDQRGAYGLVLISILVSVIGAAALGRSPWGRWFVAVLQGATLMLTLRISGARPRARLSAFVLVILGLVVAGLSGLLGDARTERVIVGVISGLLAIGAPVAIVRSVRNVEVTAQTVMAALSVYLLIGQFFAFTYGLFALVDTGPFFASGIDGTIADHVYFSYSTLTTVGFGDLTAREDIGRVASILEALIGQLYLVTVVAVLVGSLTSKRR